MQVYRAVKRRCALDLYNTRPNISVEPEVALNILTRLGFKQLEVDMIALARQCVGKSTYRRGAKTSEAPRVVDCSGLARWVYAMRGIWLPRRSIQQREVGRAVALTHLLPGDLVFTTGWKNYFYTTPEDGVGHVGIATGEGTVIHAANSRVGIVETPVDRFVGDGFCGARRYLPRGRVIHTLEIPKGMEIDSSEDVLWKLLQNL